MQVLGHLLAVLSVITLPTAAGAAGGTSYPLPAPIVDGDFRGISENRARLGRMLFYDKILSGNRNIACATCHHPDLGTSDGLSLGIGEGGSGLGPKRTVGSGGTLIEDRVPRNSPALFNLGAKEFTVLFHDGRVSVDAYEPSGFDTPAEEDFPNGIFNVVAAQAMFPVTSATEMAGSGEENPVAAEAKTDIEDVWPLLAERLRQIPEYVDLFKAAFPEIEDRHAITFVHAANAIGDFVSSEWRADDSPFDRYLGGNENALDAGQIAGMNLFYGKAGCARCHSGKFQTDHGFHAIAMPQIGYVQTRKFDPVVRDMGRVNETDRLEDRYKFRTPSLRNISETAPYGHSGVYPTLEAVVRHHLNPVQAHGQYDRTQARLPKHAVLSPTDFLVQENSREVRILLAANELPPLSLSDAEVGDLVRFLKALTDRASLPGRLGRPDRVPSGLPVD